jgi:5'-AMP-activated protein kinase catalytic alpha subunit
MAASPMVTPSGILDSRQFGGRGYPNRPPGVGETALHPDGGNVPAAKRRRWYLGIQSKKEPAHVMSEVYKALHVLQFDWKVVAPYRVKCRWQPSGATMPNASMNHVVTIGLQLYKVQQHIYLLDFQKLDGNAFTYMNLCARIITELKTLSGIRPVASSGDPRFDGVAMGGPNALGHSGAMHIPHTHSQPQAHSQMY